MVVFGHNIDACTTVQALLSLGLPGPQIHLVLVPSESGPWLLDPAVDQAVIGIMETVHIQVYQNCELQTIRTQENRVTGVTFSCRGETIEICCGALVCLCSPGLDRRMLRALLNSFLVFDGRLVVDSCFRTSDPWICAAGTMTKYSRKYYSEEWSHQRYCSTQIGQDFARQILLFFDPTSKPREESDLLPLYNRPKVTGGVLPGALHFLHVTKPSPSELNSVPYLKDKVLVTGDPASGSYFRLQLDDCERVETITCVAHKPLPLHNLLCLYGQQQSLLGNLSRGQVSDLYSFFRQSWCLAIFHDRFTDFQLELRALANHSAAETHGQEQRPSEDLDPETRTEIRSAVVRYLSYNRNLLPMFALPGHL
ncbi:unnamed protein product [Knipowitschia caucasica]|uniref:CFAP61 dimerisation domain-containing protein n=1 Tax=Knipowitschia caucasica TaxID=637954 RepID=A0AAV2KDM2_KNICA